MLRFGLSCEHLRVFRAASENLEAPDDRISSREQMPLQNQLPHTLHFEQAHLLQNPDAFTRISLRKPFTSNKTIKAEIPADVSSAKRSIFAKERVNFLVC